jgi:uncharacterized protein with PIN domain
MDSKLPHSSEEYFVRQDSELIRQHRERLDKERASLERKSHYMKCPKCGGDLTETDFHHIKVDRCPDCKGVWFDGGEIEMLEHVDQSQVRQFVRSLFGLKW